jgi:hypothetical protein
MVEIQAAITGLKYLRDFTKWVGDMRQDAETLGKINEAMRFAGDVQDKLQELREENLRLTEEKRQLADQLRAVEDWQARRAAYKLTETDGSAIVLKSEGPPPHYACTACAESKHEIHVLQDGRNMAGSYRCPSCQATYNVKPAERMPDLHFDRPY